MRIDSKRNKHRKTSLCRRLALLVTAVAMAAVVMMPAPALAKTTAGTIKITNLSSGRVFDVGQRMKLKTKVTGKYKNGAIGFKSSDYTVICVLGNGTIVPLKKGSATITAYVKKKKSISTSVQVKVGTRLESIRLSGRTLMRVGHQVQLTAAVTPENASNQSLKWTSSNKNVAVVSSKGKVTGKGCGTVTIKASAMDGSGESASIRINVFALKASDTHWIAHRGLCTAAIENTAQAYRLAGKNGFWGCECDVWETRPEMVFVPDPPEGSGAENSADAAGNGTGNGTSAADGVRGVNETGETGSWVSTREIAINHDEDFFRIWGIDRKVKDMTASEIRQTPELSQVCFLQEFLDICMKYHMVPVIELKDPDMSNEAMQQMIDALYACGPDVLSSAMIVSFFTQPPMTAREYALRTYGITPVTSLIIGTGQYRGDCSELLAAKRAGYDGVSLSKAILSDRYDTYCRQHGLRLYAWTYEDTLTADELLYQQIVNRQYAIEAFSSNGRLFR